VPWPTVLPQNLARLGRVSGEDKKIDPVGLRADTLSCGDTLTMAATPILDKDFDVEKVLSEISVRNKIRLLAGLVSCFLQ
jgi:hypothetical protein